MAKDGRISFKFDELKATQAAGRFLRKSSGKMNHLKLLKILYLMDRESLHRWGRSITGDHPYSLPYGPVLSQIYDLMKHHPLANPYSYWAEHITEIEENFLIHLKRPVDEDDLSSAEIELVDRVYEQFGAMGEFDLVKYCHDHCPEWEDPGDTSVIIPFERILREVGKSEEEIGELSREVEEMRMLDDALDRSGR
jgi:uncharacterized phage-associated protein